MYYKCLACSNEQWIDEKDSDSDNVKVDYDELELKDGRKVRVSFLHVYCPECGKEMVVGLSDGESEPE